MRRRLGFLLAASLLATLSSVAQTSIAAGPFDACEASSTTTVAIDRVTCRRIAATFLGGEAAFSYFVPAACDPVANPGRRCPTLYLLHGFGGDYTSMLGTGDAPSAWVSALATGPAVDPHTVSDPWTLSDPKAWVPKDPIGFVLIAPHGQTLDGGYGPVGGVDGFWTDWNPRFAQGGDAQAYATPPPRFESFLTHELIPYVESHLPAGSGREWRALAGTSLGGFGSYKNGLQHPDLWSSIGSVSGAHNFLFAPLPDPVPGVAAPGGLAPPVALPYTPLSSITSRIPLASLPSQLQGFAVSFLVFGDPATDQAQYRGNMPRDLAMNGRAWAGEAQSLYIRGFVNNAIPRRIEDLTSGAGYFTAQAFEAIVLPMNLEMDAAFDAEGVERSFEIHPGIHSGTYWNPFLRGQLEAQYARVRHADGGGDPTPWPARFDFRSIAHDFEIWGWTFHVARENVEFLALTDVTCSGLTLRGTGLVTVTVPEPCGTGVNGSRTFTVDLGPSFPVDEPGGASALPIYGRTKTVALSAL